MESKQPIHTPQSQPIEAAPYARVPPPPASRQSNPLAIAALITAACLVGGGAALLTLSKNKTKADSTDSSNILQSTQGAPVTPLPAPAVTTPETAHGTPTSLLKELIRGVLSRDVAKIEAAGASLDPDSKSSLAQALESGQLTIDPQKPITDLGELEDGLHRWAINVVRPADKTKGQLMVDVELDAEGNWQPKNLTLPEFLASPSENDAATELAAAFVDHLVKQDFAALGAITKKDAVPNEKLAALGLIFQEAEFQLIEDRPIRTTNITDDSAWVIAKVKSESYHLQSEIGLELKKDGEQWLVERVNVSSLMREFLDVSEREDALKAPLVANPQGGESVVLYFGYDSDQLTPRSLKQLAVITSILKQSGSKEIKIAGHTDSLGEDPYNDSLSQRRAQHVADTLRALGVRRSQIKLKAFGERVPLSPNLLPDGTDNPDGRQRNRRAEIYLDF